MPQEDSSKGIGDISPLVVFFCVLVLLAVLRVMLGFVSVPIGFEKLGTILSTVVFVSSPIFALYYAAQYRWTSKAALWFVAIGLAIHLGMGYGLAQQVFHERGFSSAACAAIAVECGFMMWCVGLGALIASLIKDRNLIIPVSIFVAAFDIFLVLTPLGPTKHLIQTMPKFFTTVAYSIPHVSATPTRGTVEAVGYIGPADFLFLGMFFVALFRFDLRPRMTLLWLVPALLLYMTLVFVLPGKEIPMMVPIGITVLAVNWTCFKMNKEEKNSTIGVIVLALAIIVAGFALHKPTTAPSQPASSQAAQEPASSPKPISPGQPR